MAPPAKGMPPSATIIPIRDEQEDHAEDDQTCPR